MTCASNCSTPARHKMHRKLTVFCLLTDWLMHRQHSANTWRRIKRSPVSIMMYRRSVARQSYRRSDVDKVTRQFSDTVYVVWSTAAQRFGHIKNTALLKPRLRRRRRRQCLRWRPAVVHLCRRHAIHVSSKRRRWWSSAAVPADNNAESLDGTATRMSKHHPHAFVWTQHASCVAVAEAAVASTRHRRNSTAYSAPSRCCFRVKKLYMYTK